MRVLARIATLMAVILGTAVCAASQSAAPQSKEVKATGTITGRVTIDGKPAAYVPVSLMADPYTGMGGGLNISSLTDLDGHFQLTKIPAGRVYVAASAPAYYSENNNYSPGNAVTVTEGENIDGIDIALRRGGVITGRLTDAAGRPLIQKPIQLYQFNPQGEEHYRQIYRTRFTDDRGVYRIFGLPPGRYFVSAGTPKEGRQNTEGSSYYPQTFYPGAVDVTKASEVEVTEGGEASGIDIVMGRTEKAYTVNGRVIDATTGKPIAGIYCRYSKPASEEGEPLMPLGSPVMSNEKGEFHLDGVPPGKYAATIMPKMDSGQNYTFDPVTFEVTDADVSSIEIKTRQGASLSGTVVFDGLSTSDAAAYFKDLRISIISENQALLPGLGTPVINPDGSFIANSLPSGKMQFRVFSVGGRYDKFTLLRIERDGVEQPGGIDVTEGETTTGVQVVVGAGTGTVRGELRMAEGPLPAGVQFGFALQRVSSSTPQFYRYVQVDARGRFVADNLFPGDYQFVLNVNYNRQNVKGPVPEFKPISKTVTVTNDSETPVTIVLEPVSKDGQQ